MDDITIDSVLLLAGRTKEIREQFKEAIYFEDVHRIDKYLLLAEIMNIDLLFEITLPIAINLNNIYITESIVSSACFKKFAHNITQIINSIFKKGWIHILDMLGPQHYRYSKITIESLNDINTWRMCENYFEVNSEMSFSAAIHRDDAILFLELYKCGIKMSYNKLVPLILINNALSCFKAFHKLKGGSEDKKIKEILNGPEYLQVINNLNIEIISYMYEKNILPYSCDIWVYLISAVIRRDLILCDWLIKNIGLNTPIDEKLVRQEIEGKNINYDEFMYFLRERENEIRRSSRFQTDGA